MARSVAARPRSPDASSRAAALRRKPILVSRSKGEREDRSRVDAPVPACGPTADAFGTVIV